MTFPKNLDKLDFFETRQRRLRRAISRLIRMTSHTCADHFILGFHPHRIEASAAGRPAA